MRGHAADPSVDLVEDERLASRDGREREGDPGEPTAGGSLRDGSERKAGVRPDEEDDLVGPGCVLRFARVELCDELALPQPESLELSGYCLGERPRARAAPPAAPRRARRSAPPRRPRRRPPSHRVAAGSRSSSPRGRRPPV